MIVVDNILTCGNQQKDNLGVKFMTLFLFSVTLAEQRLAQSEYWMADSCLPLIHPEAADCQLWVCQVHRHALFQNYSVWGICFEFFIFTNWEMLQKIPDFSFLLKNLMLWYHWVCILQGHNWLGLPIAADGDCSHEIKRRLLLGRKLWSI